LAASYFVGAVEDELIGSIAAVVRAGESTVIIVGALTSELVSSALESAIVSARDPT